MRWGWRFLDSIKHSISPQLHQAALKAMAFKEPKFNSWNYRKIEVHPSDLAAALPRLAEFGFRGLNLTIPHKVDALQLISSIDQQALVMGAVNTLSFENNGWKGYNTDGVGLSRAIKQSFQKTMKDCNVLIVGAGGAARAAVVQCLQDGCTNLAIFNRTVDRAKELCKSLKRNGVNDDVRVLDSIFNPFSGSDLPILIINATSVGLRSDDPAPIDLSVFSGDVFVFDRYTTPGHQVIDQLMRWVISGPMA